MGLSMSWDPWPRPVATPALSLAASTRASGTPSPVGPGTPSRLRPASRDSPASAGVRQRLRPREPASADPCPPVRSSGLPGSGSPGPLNSLARSAGGLSPLPGRPRRRLGEGLRLAPRVPPGSAGRRRRRRPRCLSPAPPQAGRGASACALPCPLAAETSAPPEAGANPPAAERAQGTASAPAPCSGRPARRGAYPGWHREAPRSVARQRRVASRFQPSQRLPHTGRLGARPRGLAETIAGPPSIPAPPVTERTGPGLPRARCLAWRLLLGGRPSLGGENRPARAVVPLGWRLHRGVSLRKPPKSLLK